MLCYSLLLSDWLECVFYENALGIVHGNVHVLLVNLL